MRIRRTLWAALLGIGLVAATTPGAHGRTDNRTKPIVYVHGFDATFSPGYDCNFYWDIMADRLASFGHTGERVTVDYYALDYNCTYDLAHHGSHSTHYAGGHSGGSHTRNTSIRHLGYHLAWMIYDHFTSQGKTVDIVGHSMGGVIARYAVAGVATQQAGFPPSLSVEDVVTLGTPHAGTGWAWGCAYTECVEMRPGSSFVNWLAANGNNPQGTGGTDWTTIGSEDDQIVDEASAVTMGAAHRANYLWYQNIDHVDYIIDTSSAHDADIWRSENGGSWTFNGDAPHAVRFTDYAFVYGTW